VHFKVKNIKGHRYLYLIQNANVDGKHRQVKQVYVGSPEQVEKLLEGIRDVKIKSYSFGRSAAMLHAAERLDLVRIIDRNVRKKDVKGLTVGEYALLLIAGRTEGALSRNGIDEWYRTSVLQFLMDPEYSLSSKNLINQMDRLDEEAIHAIERDLAARLVELGISPSRLIFDTTNRYSYIEHGQELPRKGFSKQKRFDKNIVGLALTVNEDNLPFMSDVYPGSEHDSTVFKRVFEAMCQRLEDLEIEARDMALVFDKGINSDDNVEMILERMHLVGSVPRSMAEELLKAPMSRFKHVYTNAKGHDISAWRTRETFYGREFEVVVQYSPATRKKNEQTYEKRRARILQGVETIRASCTRKGRGRKPSEKGIINRLGDLVPRDLRGVFDYGIETTEEGRPCPWLKVKDDEEKAYRRSLGLTAVFTDHAALSTEEILRAYNSKYLIEEDFKWMEDKVIIPVWPFFVRRDRAIRAHVFLVVLGLMLYRLVQHDLGGDSMYLPTLAKALDDIRIALVSEGRRKPKFIVEEMDTGTARIFTKLELSKYLPS
jgi:transposase